MALSQVQCLDDNNVNWRVNESKPEFFYSEEQRLALEALLHGGREGFQKVLETHNVRKFLSNPELERLAGCVQDYQPGAESVKQEGDGEDAAVSLQYWPERSDIDIPELDMGWPDCASYRGVTRANVYTQPPMEGQTHIKEVVRKMIVQAQKVVAVVMDMFTDVDIFKDLLDASFKRKVPVYIILESTGVQHFLEMCERARMHRGHLKNLRVRSIAGTEFYTHSSKKVCGMLSQKFMFVDGDRAVSGSYSFTWTASRLDRNLITMLTGQAVETYDKQFRDLYLLSRGVDLGTIPLEDEPEPEPLPQSLPPPPPSAAVARKLINPKYALVSSGAVETGSGTSSGKNSMKNNGNNNPMVKNVKPPPEPVEAPPIHPGLLNLERANMIAYLPTWPEPDPPSDVIGFINIRDTNKPMQAHLMRSELFETSQAIRFKMPFAPPEETLPEKATLRQKPDTAPAQPSMAPKLQVTEPQPQSTQDTPAERSEPQRDTVTSENDQGKVDIPLPPVPKPRTIQLVIKNDSNKDTPEIISIVTKPSKDPTSTTEAQDSQGQTRNSNLDNHMDLSKDTSNSNVSSTSEEYFECCDSENTESRLDLIANGLDCIHSGSGRLGDHRHPNTANCMARLSQSLVDLRPESHQHAEKKELQNSKALEDIRKVLEKTQKQAIRGPHYSDGRKVSTCQPRGPVKVVIAKPGCYHRPAKAAAPVIGGHKYWHSKTGPGHLSPQGRSAPNGLPPSQADSSRTPFGISLAKLAQIKHLRGRIPGGTLGTLQKKLGHKGVV
ncbi:FA83G protein, partial [Atractosteus spatula]|nr:FA83G protein [Atractosteus spatula]